jgi:hypothetical protein
MTPVELLVYQNRDGRYRCRLRRSDGTEIRTEDFTPSAAALRAIFEMQDLDECAAADVHSGTCD